MPFLMRWPNHIVAGQRPAIPAHHLDVFATLAAAAGASMPTDRKMDSLNLLPFVTDKSAAMPERTIVWRSGSYRAIADGRWKLQVTERPARLWLFDMTADPTERQNVAAGHPDEIRRLKTTLAEFDRQMPSPMWPALLDTPVRIDVPSDVPWKADQEYIYWSN